MTKLILHVGLGKTGTTAFQDAIRDSFDSLKEAGFLCAGPRLRFAVPAEDELEAQFHAGEPEYLPAALSALEKAAANAPEVSTVIWSNETIGMAPDLTAVVGIIKRFIDQTQIFDQVEIAMCLRRQDEWAESAYRQWGLKHKMIEARGIETPEAWLERSWDALDYLSQYRIWSTLGANRIRVMTYDAMRDAGGSVPYLCAEFGILSDLLPPDAMGKSNVSLGPAQSYMNALFNGSHDEAVRPVEFAKLLADYELPELDNAESVFVSSALRQTILDRCQADNDTLGREVLGRDHMFDDTPVGGQNVYVNGTEDALIYLSKIVSTRLRDMEKPGYLFRKFKRPLKAKFGRGS